MLTMTGLIVLIAITLVIWFWQSSMKAKELAIAASKNACSKRHLQFLDGTISFQKIRLKRNETGRVRFKRHYRFDYYNGQARLTSTIVIFDNRVTELDLPPIEAQSEPNNVIQFPKRG